MTTEEKKTTTTGLPAWMAGVGMDSDMEGDAPSAMNRVFRFWLPKGKEADIIFLNEGDEAPVIWEHQIRLGGDWRNWATCMIQAGQSCPLCKWADANNGQFKRYKVMYFSIIDCSKYTDRKGVEHVNTKKLFGAKKDTKELIRRLWLRRKEADTGLRGAMYNAYRTNSDKSANVGEQFEFKKMVDLATLEDAEAFNFAEVIAPDKARMTQIMNRLRRETGGGGVEGTDSQVPFDAE